MVTDYFQSYLDIKDSEIIILILQHFTQNLVIVYCFYRIPFFKSLNLLFGYQFTFLLLHLIRVICSEGSLRLTDASGCRHFRWPQSLSNKRHSVPEDRDKGMMVLNKYIHRFTHTPLIANCWFSIFSRQKDTQAMRNL